MLIEWHGLKTSRVHAELLAQADIEPVRQHDEARRNLLAVRQRERLPVGAGRDRASTLAWMNAVAGGISARIAFTSAS